MTYQMTMDGVKALQSGEYFGQAWIIPKPLTNGVRIAHGIPAINDSHVFYYGTPDEKLAKRFMRRDKAEALGLIEPRGE